MSGDQLIKEYLGVGGDVLAARPHNIVQDRFDSTLYDDLRASSEALQGLEAKGAGASFPALLQDFWATFYKASPELQAEDRVAPGHAVNRPFVERLLEDSATKEARLSTMLDDLSAGVAAIHAGGAMLKEINERQELKEAFKRAEEASRAEEAGDGETAERLMAEALQNLQGAARDVRRAVRGAVQAGKEKAEEMQGVLAGWGLEPGDLQHVPVGERLKLAELLTGKRIKNVADLVGRMRNLARARQRSKIKKQRDEVHSITVGGDLQQALPVEMAALKHPLRRLDFYRRFTEKQLLQYELRGQEKLAKGPVVALIDISGSMHGFPLAWAVACALALVDTAARQKRFAHAIFFDTEVKATFSFAPGERDINKYAAMAGIGTAGGTDYTPALQAAREAIGKQPELKDADIVMVTDGLFRLYEGFISDFNRWKSEAGVRCYTVLIGHDPDEELKKWSDRVWQVRSLDDESAAAVAGDIFEEIY